MNAEQLKMAAALAKSYVVENKKEIARKALIVGCGVLALVGVGMIVKHEMDVNGEAPMLEDGMVDVTEAQPVEEVSEPVLVNPE